MYDLHLLLDNCITSLYTRNKILFIQYPEERIFIYLVKKYPRETQISQYLAHFRPTPTWSGLCATQKKMEFWGSFSGKNSVIF